ncbi:glycosyltransferase family 9 protein [Gluconacetobacter entanii]|nr:glycosyltransferase family 9 protein [Gluconacetobacter entanii]
MPLKNLIRIPPPRRVFRKIFNKKSNSNNQEWDRRLAAADAARDMGRFSEAAKLYLHALEIREDQGIRIQVGHMYKEARDFPSASRHYLSAYKMNPADPEISCQLGHFYKTIGRYEDALHFYRSAVTLKPGWKIPAEEAENLEKSSELLIERSKKAFLEASKDGRLSSDIELEDFTSPLLDGTLIPRSYEDLCINHQEVIVPTRHGTPQHTEWGQGLTVRGIAALRGYFVSSVLLERIDIFMDGKLFHSEPLTIAAQPREKSNHKIRKYCYNAWVDFTDVKSGWHDFTFRAQSSDLEEEVENKTWYRQRLIVAPPFPEYYYQNSDAIIAPIDKGSSLSIVDQINARPSVLHRCTTRSIPFDIKTIAVLRPDQLGDLVASIPSLRKIRTTFPDAKIVGLLGRANEALARTLGIFDDIVIVEFPDDPVSHQRVMPLEEQVRLKKKLAQYKFDLAVDLPVSANSYKLLPLLQAPLTVGFGGPRKSMDLNFSSYDPSTGCDFIKHSARTAIIGEAISLAMDSGARVEKRDDITRDTLVPYGVPATEPYIVIHSGARIKFTHWPHYVELAERIVREMNVRVVYMAENAEQKARLPEELLNNGMIVYITGQMPFDHFDTFLSFASVFVGNDSGPKHLASLRGAQVVSLHSSRIGWEEWGQERGGIAISRRVPCAGCSLHHNYDECAKDVACIKLINIDEVYGAVQELFSNPS